MKSNTISPGHFTRTYSALSQFIFEIDRCETNHRVGVFGSLPMLILLSMMAIASTAGAGRGQDSVNVENQSESASNVFSRWKGSWVESDFHSGYCVSTNKDLLGVAFVWNAPNMNRMRGRVVDARNKPVGGANIFARVTCHGVPLCEESTTDDSGNFEIELPVDPMDDPLQWTLRATKGKLTGVVTADSSKPQSDLVITTTLGGMVSIRLHEEETGKPIEDFYIFFRSNRLFRSRNGVCVVEGLPTDNKSTLFAPIARGRASYRYNLDLAGDLPTDLDLPLVKGGTAHCIIKDTSGNPAPFRPVSMLNTLSVQVLTNARGEAKVSGVPYDRPAYIDVATTFQTSGKSWGIERIPVDIGDAAETKIDCEVPVQPYTREAPQDNAMIAAMVGKEGQKRSPGAVFGKVIKPDGTVCKQFSVRLNRGTKQTVPKSNINYLYELTGAGVSFGNTDGQFMITQVDADTYVDVHVSADGFSDAVFRDVLIPSAANCRDIPLIAELYEPVDHTVTFLDDQGNPSVGKTVYLCRGENNAIADIDRMNVVRSAVTDEQGNAVFNQIPIDEGVLVMRSENGQDQYFGFDPSHNTFTVESSKEVTLKFLVDDLELDNIEIVLRPKTSFRSSDSIKAKVTNGECKLSLRKSIYTIFVRLRQPQEKSGNEKPALHFENGKTEMTLDLGAAWDGDLRFEFPMSLKPNKQ